MTNEKKLRAIHHQCKGTYEQYKSSVKLKALKSAQTQKKKAVENKLIALIEWQNEKHTCESCGKLMTEKFGSGRFCSRYSDY